MDPSSLFAPGGIVQGLSNLGNSIGDSFKSYALIRKERDDADMARTKMLFDAQDKIKDRELEQQRLDATMKFQQGQQANDRQRTIFEGRRTAVDEQRAQADVAREAAIEHQQKIENAGKYGAVSGLEGYVARGDGVPEYNDIGQAQQAYQKGAASKQADQDLNRQLTQSEIAKNQALTDAAADKGGTADNRVVLENAHKRMVELDPQLKSLQSQYNTETDPDKQSAIGMQLAPLQQEYKHHAAVVQALMDKMVKDLNVTLPESKKPAIRGGGGGNAGNSPPTPSTPSPPATAMFKAHVGQVGERFVRSKGWRPNPNYSAPPVFQPPGRFDD